MTKQDNFQTEGADVHSDHAKALDELKLREKITIHMCHLNHLDLMWHWQVADSYQMMLDTIRGNVKMLERHPDCVYSHTQVFMLAIVEKLDPDLFRRFQRLVENGQIELDSGQVVEPDHNLPSGESLARQFLYGQGWLQEKFGRTSTVSVNSDTFGHCRNLPQILKQAGIEAFIFKRPRQKWVDLPEHPFIWQGLDGTKILALRFSNKGNGLPLLSQYYTFPDNVNPLQKKIDWNLQIGNSHFFASHCHSDSGGASPYVPEGQGENWQLKYSRPSEFVAALEKQGIQYPVIDKHLNFVYQACYTTSIIQKEFMRRAERELFHIELLHAYANLQGISKYPIEAIREAWWTVCFLAFHDIVTGTGSPETFIESEALYRELFLKLTLLRRQAQLALEKKFPTVEDKSVLLVNLSGAATNEPVAVDIDLETVENGASSGFYLVDDQEKKIPGQITEMREYQRFKRGTLVFRPNLGPGLSCRNYRLVTSTVADRAGSDLLVNIGELKNSFFHLRFDPQGNLLSLFDLKLNTPIFGPQGLGLEFWPETEYKGDYGLSMKAWFLGVTGEINPARPSGKPRVVEDGPVRASIATFWRSGKTETEMVFTLYAGAEFIDVKVTADWQEKETLLRLALKPLLPGEQEYFYGVPFGTDRAESDGAELPIHGWACAQNSTGGFAVFSADRPGFCFQNGSMYSSIVRCSTGEFHPASDQGRITAAYRLWPYAGDHRQAQIPAKAQSYCFGPSVWQQESGPSVSTKLESPPKFEIHAEGINISAFKKTEDGTGLLLRLHETHGRSSPVNLDFSGLGKLGACHQSDILERKGKELPLRSGILSLNFQPYEIKTVLFG